jgi:hypothetical protein
LLWVIPGADFGLYFFVKRPQDLPMNATKMILPIIERNFGSEGEGAVQCRERLGGMPRYYHREAA